jgi:hypothetical protein
MEVCLKDNKKHLPPNSGVQRTRLWRDGKCDMHSQLCFSRSIPQANGS